ncbi:UbiA prenyltransferase family-domain-containing protein [Coniella lustricola]|uniref:UbiA prenyltransferase family-domain-containing protein n=1 Tax=Coniella lustricola TaxID=2025994 RepID=A0A2T2ZYG9_9PEZI|nr:UbiA prenyltransferase family-domain-containing protein [Coniella lustricola]
MPSWSPIVFESQNLLKQGDLISPNSCFFQVMMSITRFKHHLHTLVLFTYSDIKAVILPQSTFAISLFFSSHDIILPSDAALPDFTCCLLWRLAQMFAWLWLHLLILDLSNQRLPESVAEDALNKPWRPLPSKRLTSADASWLLTLAVPLGMGLSLLTGLEAYVPSTTLLCLCWLYNDLEGSSSSLIVRNLLNALGLTCFGWGALAVLAGPGAQLLMPNAAKWMCITVAIIFTTIHVQDFRDEAGDRARGRRSIALEFSPFVARGSCIISILFWSIAAPAFWTWPLTESLYVTLVTVGLGAVVSGLLIARHSQRMDEHALTVWCLWVGWIYLLPVLL